MIDVSAVAVVDGATVVIGPPSNVASVGICAAVLDELLPAETVEHQEHDLPGVAHRSGHPVPVGAPMRVPAASGTMRAHVGAGVVGEESVGRSRGTSVHHLDGAGRASRESPGAAQKAVRWVVRVSSKGDYACRALLSLALHMDETGPTSVRDIAERTGLPQPYLEQILLALKGAGLVRSKRGVGGGYVLARQPGGDPARRDPRRAVDGPISLGDFGEPHQDGACDHEGQCVLLAIWKSAGEQMRRLLEGSRCSPLPMPRAASPRGRRPARGRPRYVVS